MAGNEGARGGRISYDLDYFPDAFSQYEPSSSLGVNEPYGQSNPQLPNIFSRSQHDEYDSGSRMTSSKIGSL